MSRKADSGREERSDMFESDLGDPASLIRQPFGTTFETTVCILIGDHLREGERLETKSAQQGKKDKGGTNASTVSSSYLKQSKDFP